MEDHVWENVWLEVEKGGYPHRILGNSWIGWKLSTDEKVLCVYLFFDH